MAYGKGGRLGDSINPALGAMDFSGFAQAGAIKGQAMGQMGYDIGDIVKQRSEQKKRDAQNEKFLKQALDMFQGTDLEGPVGAAYQEYISEETSDKQRRAIGESIRETIGLGMAAQDMRMQKMALNAKLQGGPDTTMVLSPQEVDQYSNAGYALEIVGRNQDGSLIVKDMNRKAAGGTGGFVPFYNENTGTFGMQPSPPQSFAPTPGGAQSPDAIQQAAMGFPPQQIAADPNIQYVPTSLPMGGGMDGLGVLPPRNDIGAPLAASPATGVAPNADFFAKGGAEAVQIPGSMRDLDAQLKKQQIEKAGVETELAKAKSAEESAKEAKGRESFSSYVGNIANAYAELDKMGGAVSTSKSASENIKSYIAGSDIGKSVGSAVGSETAAMRAIIDSQTPGIINVIRQSSEMGAKGMDSDAERKFYVTALGTQQLPVEANIRALIELDKAYGKGDVAKVVKDKNPALYARAMNKKYAYESSDKKQGNIVDDDVENILQGLGL